MLSRPSAVGTFFLLWLFSAPCVAECRRCEQRLDASLKSEQEAKADLRGLSAELIEREQEVRQLRQELEDQRSECEAVRNERDELQKRQNALADQTLRYIEDIPRQYSELFSDLEVRFENEIRACDDSLREEVRQGFEDSYNAFQEIARVLVDEFGKLDVASGQLLHEQEQVRLLRREKQKLENTLEKSQRLRGNEIDGLREGLEFARRETQSCLQGDAEWRNRLVLELETAQKRLEAWEGNRLCRGRSSCPDGLRLSRREESEVRRLVNDLRSRLQNLHILVVKQ